MPTPRAASSERRPAGRSSSAASINAGPAASGWCWQPASQSKWENDMERSVALKKLGKLLGKDMGWRVNPKAPTHEEREAAQAALKPALEDRARLETAKRQRLEAVLAADTE